MAFKTLLFHFLCIFLFLSFFHGQLVEAAGSRKLLGFDLGFLFPQSRLFVFGDSYAAAGNNDVLDSESWKYPYGVTYPGIPSGRFSDGRVLTDYFADFLKITSPVSYKQMLLGFLLLKSGMNFAVGGTGVFNTMYPGPNMTVQIDNFQDVVKTRFYSKDDLKTSMALVSVVGNDYSTFITKNNSALGLLSFIPKVVGEIEENLKRIYATGVKKVVVTGLQPLGCLPRSTASNSFKQCNDTQNTLVGIHNDLLNDTVTKLNKETQNGSFLFLDLYSAFMDVLNQEGADKGSGTFKEPYKPCCYGVDSESYCGTVDDLGVQKYTLCKDPSSSFFWDGAHPTQAGWAAIWSTPAVKNTLKQL